MADVGIVGPHVVRFEQDLQRRDLTINAIARAPDGRLVDPFGGEADLRAVREAGARHGEAGEPLRGADRPGTARPGDEAIERQQRREGRLRLRRELRSGHHHRGAPGAVRIARRAGRHS